MDTGVVGYVTALIHNWFGWNLNPAGHGTILVITLILLAIQSTVNITGARVMADVAKFGVYVEIVGTLGIAIILAIHGFHHGLGFLFSTQGAQHAATNAFGLELPRELARGAALVAVLAPVYIFYGFESCGDIAEETKDAGRQIPRAMRHALIWGGVASFILTAAPAARDGEAQPGRYDGRGGGIPGILAQLPSWMQDFLLLADHLRLLLLRLLDPGGRQPARVLVRARRRAARVGLDLARQPAVQDAGQRAARWALSSRCSSCCWCTSIRRSNYHIWFVTYPAHVNALIALVSFGVSGIYLSFLLTVIGAIVAHARGWKPEGAFRLGKWTWPVLIIAGGYLAAMFVNVVYPSGLTSARAILQPRLDHALHHVPHRRGRRALPVHRAA